MSDIAHKLHDSEEQLLNRLRQIRRRHRSDVGVAPALDPNKLTMGQKIADAVASNMGSWRFIIIQSTILFFWVVANVTAFIFHWDPYPFILLNLALSFQAAYAAPFIMMSQNRQGDIDRMAAQHDYDINIKAELEIESLHAKIDSLREKEVLNLTATVRELTELLKAERAAKA
ncbi:MAG: DUF1003 domain-containing protein [Alphaproteobacteria bacterium]|nr:DUF1003 domain-containing protein [Alphaproteobacteria bacterium]MBV9418822.1 DUF1003 domain-containing protein [Alphaproteobacteria bacterium]